MTADGLLQKTLAFDVTNMISKTKDVEKGEVIYKYGNEVILTESDQIGSLDGTPEVKDIKAISINGKNYYLVYLEIGR